MSNSDKIQKLFDTIASKYDFMNNIISFGTHNKIKKSAINKLKLKSGAKVLDLCCGTGDISNLLAEKKEVIKVIGVDFSENMLELAKEKTKNEKIEYILADCTNLPFENNSFDAVTICFGLRNIEDKKSVINEIYRILKSNGQLLHLDFEKGNTFADFAFDNLTPFLAKVFYSKNKEAYNYLVKSKQDFYTPKELIEYLSSQNFSLSNKYSFLLSSVSSQIFIKN